MASAPTRSKGVFPNMCFFDKFPKCFPPTKIFQEDLNIGLYLLVSFQQCFPKKDFSKPEDLKTAYIAKFPKCFPKGFVKPEDLNAGLGCKFPKYFPNIPKQRNIYYEFVDKFPECFPHSDVSIQHTSS